MTSKVPTKKTSQMTQGTRRPYSEDEVKADVNVKMTELWLFLNC